MNGGGNLPVGPGIWGFIAFFVLAIALWLLVRNMNSRLRRMAYTDRERAEAAAAEAAARESKGEGGSQAPAAPEQQVPGQQGPGQQGALESGDDDATDGRRDGR